METKVGKFALASVSILVLLTAAVTAQAPKTGGELRLAREADSSTMDLTTSTANLDIWVGINIFESLVKFSDDGTTIVPSLAERWEASADGKTYTFFLRPNLKFSDGTPLTATDVAFAIDRARSAKEAAWSWTLAQVDRVETPNARTVRVKLKQRWSPILSDLALFDTGVYPKAYFQKVGASGMAAKPLGSGPFYLAEWKRGDYILLKKNANYYDAKNVKLDAARFLAVPDENTRVLKLLAGEADAIGFVPFSRIKELQNNADVSMILNTSTRTDYLLINNARKPFGDVKVRQAISLAIDRNAIVKTALFGFGEPASSFLPKGAIAWDTSLKPYPFDPGRALQLIRESTVPNGFTANLLISAGSVTENQVATLIKEDLRVIGVTVNIQQIEPGQLIPTQQKGDYDISLEYWTNDIIDPDELVSFAIDFTQGGDSFFTKYKNDQVGKLAQLARLEPDQARREQLYKQIQRIWYNDQHMLALYYSPFRNATRKWVQDFIQNPLGYWSLTKAWLSR